AAIKRLDVFEGELYARQHIEVVTEEHGLIDSMTYVIKPEHSGILTRREWSYEQFLASGKTKFKDAYFGFDELDETVTE
ncbi:MAG: gamma-glutamylcyclotransferase family protein, partial [Desulforhopalus sp.]